MPKTNPQTKQIKCEIYSRVVGYHRPIQQWNAGKQAEYKQRNTFNEERSILSPLGQQAQIKETIKTLNF